MSNKMIEVVQLGKTYRTKRRRLVTALSDVSFHVDAGEAFGFIGPNGAGKSTTIKILTGLIKASSGEARLQGLPVSDPASRQGVSYVPENPSLYDYLTPLEVVMMGAQLHKLKKPDLRAHCMGWLERFDMAGSANRPIRGLSKGMAQRTALAHALAVEPKLLILDEPLSGLDPIGRHDVVEILLAYRQAGGSILFSSHVLHDVDRLADRFGLIHRGTLRTVQRPEELAGGESRVLVRSLGTQAVEGMTTDVGGRWSGSVRTDEVWALLERLKAAGHTLIEVKPAMTLESAFIRYVSST